MPESNRCFLCDSDENVTEEHVFPQWLLKKANIRNQFVTLKNGTKFKYGNVRVPCCQECNNEELSQIENKISTWINKSDFEKLQSNPDTVFIWLYKIMYGLNYKEMHVKKDLRNPNSPPLVEQDEFFERISYNLFPLFAKHRLFFKEFKPYSLFIFEIESKTKDNFFYFDEPYKMISGIVVNDIAIACSFQCDGYIEEDINNANEGVLPKKISVPNFGDFCAYLLALKSRMKTLPPYTVFLRNDVFVFQRKEHDHSSIYNDHDPKLYTEFMTKYFNRLFDPLIKTDSHGNRSISYKSPFKQF